MTTGVGQNTSQSLLAPLRTMALVRAFETTVFDLHHRGIVVENLHDSRGQEAVAVGVCSQLKAQDYLASTHRAHAHCIARGLDIRSMLAELLGREGAYCKGRGGSMNLADRSAGFLGANNVVAASIGMATGAALTSAYRGDGSVAVAITWDGGPSQGLFHEALNLAALWKLPVVFIVENNQFAVSVPVEAQIAGGDIASRASGYGIPGETVDGNDVVAVAAAARRAVDRARSGAGPSLVEARTYRVGLHWSGDWGGYRDEARTREAVEKRDPVQLYVRWLHDEHPTLSVDMASIEAEAADVIGEAVLEVSGRPMLDVSDAIGDVYGTDWVGHEVDYLR